MTSLAFAYNNNQFFTGGVDNVIHKWDTRTNSKIHNIMGHNDTITFLSSCLKNNNHLLSHGVDSKILSWDVRPFVASNSHKGKFSMYSLILKNF